MSKGAADDVASMLMDMFKGGGNSLGGKGGSSGSQGDAIFEQARTLLKRPGAAIGAGDAKVAKRQLAL